MSRGTHPRVGVDTLSRPAPATFHAGAPQPLDVGLEVAGVGRRLRHAVHLVEGIVRRLRLMAAAGSVAREAQLVGVLREELELVRRRTAFLPVRFVTLAALAAGGGIGQDTQ